MFCTTCGNLIPEGSRTCSKCGAEHRFGTSGQGSGIGVTGTLEHYTTHSGQSPVGGRNSSDLVGQVVDGKYRLDSELGRSEVGVVYRATRLMIGDTVAVKIILPEHVSDQKSVQRFRREAQATALLKHPNVVAIYDFGTTSEGLVYLVMELVEGQSLRQIIKEQGSLSPYAASMIISQVCAALDEAHSHNIIHRDLKPESIVITTTKSGVVVKVLDFGLAKLLDSETVSDNSGETGTVIGAPHYMSPEQFLGEDLDGRSDVYSLGIVLYEMLAGVVPFSSPTPTAVIVQHVNQLPPSLHARNASIPPAVDAVVLRALEKRRDARQQTALELAQELSAAVSGETHGHQPTNFQVTEKLPSRASTQGTPQRTTIPTMVGNAPPPRDSMIGSVVHQPSTAVLSNVTNKNPEAGSRKRLLMIIVAVVFALGLAGGAMAWWIKRTNQEKLAAEKSQSDKGPAQSANQAGSADVELAELQERRRSATSLEMPKVNEDIIEAENKYPADYRFTYERAKIHIEGVTQHTEHFRLLTLAARKAIDSGKADQMLADLERDKDTDFHKLSKGHAEWPKLNAALSNKDTVALSHVSHNMER